MSKKFIDQVRAIILQNISDENFGVRELATHLSLSSSQTLRKVKAASGKSVNQYIRELRLEKAAKLIKKTDHTIAEISYKVGFSSASYFNTAFSKYYGISPGEYKSKSISLSELNLQKPKEKINTGSFKQKIYLPILYILIVIVGFLIYHQYSSPKTSSENSIAVLPFKDFSPEDNQWFSDGVSDNILHSLAQMNELKVISFTSSSTYRNSNKQISKISKELGVSYILEGSVTLVDGKIKIITQLINNKDEHIWSKEYNESFEDVIKVQKEVAQEVLNQMKVTLSSKDEENLKKYPTENMEAYSWYLKGKSILQNTYDLENQKKKLAIFEKAIELDSNFVEPYTELAYIHYMLAEDYSEIINPFSSREKSLYYANKALTINSKSSEAWTIKGILLSFKDWNKSKEYINKAIELNPNNDLAHNSLRIYYEYSPKQNFKKAYYHAKIAVQLNPFDRDNSGGLYFSLQHNNKLEEAQKLFERNEYMLTNSQKIYFKLLHIGIKNKNWKSMIPLMDSVTKKEPNNPENYMILSQFHKSFNNDDINACLNAKKAFEIDSTNNFSTNFYITTLIKANSFDKAINLMESDNFKNIASKKEQLNRYWEYHYYKRQYQEALYILNDSVFKNQYAKPIFTYAQLGDRKKVDSLEKRFPWGTGKVGDYHNNKAILHAILKNRDSMYYYLDRIFKKHYFSEINIRPEFDPYRNEDRFKLLLKANYFSTKENSN